MIPRDRAAGVILAGGKSSRMGENKALLRVNGKAMIQHVAEVMRSVFEEIMVVSDLAEPYRFLGLRVVPDVYKERGPLGGLHAAFRETNAAVVFVVSCDTPFVSADLIKFVVDSHSGSGATVVSASGEIQPLFGVYTKEVLPIADEMLSEGSCRLKDFLKRIDAKILPLSPEHSWYKPQLLQNINTPAEYQSAKNLGRSGQSKTSDFVRS